MTNTKKINQASEKYRKYLTSIKLDNKKYYFIYGSDSDNDSKDYIVLDNSFRMLFYDSIETLLKSLFKKNINTNDSKNFNKWLSFVNKYIDDKSHYSYASYNIDLIYNNFIKKSMLYLDRLKRKDLKEFVDFINLVNDYSIQTNNRYLKKLTKERSVIFLWEYYYNVDIWKKDKESEFETLFKDFNEIDFRINIAKIFAFFISRINFITK